MNAGKYVFAQIADHLPSRIFDKCVARYSGNKHLHHFKCWNQLLSMMFGQISNRDSLRDLLVCIEAHSSKYYHLGFGKNVSRSNLANANEKRDYRIFEDFAYEVINIARSVCLKDSDFNLGIKSNIYALDATVIDLCLSVFWWAAFRQNKGAVKIHALYDIKTSIPSFILITPGDVHEVHGMDHITYERGAYYIMDRAYLDFKRLFILDSCGSFFVTRTKRNSNLIRITSLQVDKDLGVKYDQIVKVSSFYPAKDYPKKLRRIKYHDSEQNRTLVFLTNNFKLKATTIAALYKNRWKVELFFKWIKQHLKIKSFWGQSENAVKTQIYIAIITYTLVAIIRNRIANDRSTYEILQILSVSLLDKTPLNQLLAESVNQEIKERDYNQLKLSLI